MSSSVTLWQKVMVFLDENKDKHFTDNIIALSEKYDLIEKSCDKHSKSGEYIQRCIDIMNADPNVSDDTKILMFVEYGKLLMKEKL